MPTITPRASKAAMTDVYEDHKQLIRGVARRFARRYGRDLDETLGAAHQFYLEAYHTFDPDCGTVVEQRLQYSIWQRLYDQMRDELERAELLPRVDVDPSLFTSRYEAPAFDREELESELGDNARTVLALILDTPGDLLEAIQSERNPTPASIRRCTHRYLRNRLKWTASAIRETFEELREVLS